MQHHGQLHRPSDMRHRERDLHAHALFALEQNVSRQITWMLEMSFEMLTPPAPLIILRIPAE
jgi:hypothetical protein